MKKVAVTYLGHSGYMAETESAVFIMDYLTAGPARARDGFSDGAIRPEELAGMGKPVYVLVSHAHRDHFDPAIFSWAGEVPRCIYLLGEGVPARTGRVLSPGERWEDGCACVTAFGSTDEGVSFRIEADGLNLFHAGDFNLWHWREESTPEEIAEAEDLFQTVLGTMASLPVDVAFFPTDPRMGEMYYTGGVAYIETVHPRVFFPMHFWQDESVPAHFARVAKRRGTRIMQPQYRGQRFELCFPEEPEKEILPE